MYKTRQNSIDLSDNIGIIHVFSCINICRVPRKLFEHEADRPSVQHHPRDPASVNAMKQTCVIFFLHILPYSSSIRTENMAKTLNCPFSYTGFLKTKWRRLCTFERHYVITVRNVFANKNIGEMISLVRNTFRI